MPETDILNPTTIWEEDIQDSMTPNYGFTRKRPATRSLKKAVGGVPYTREMGNTGHSFTFSWIGRTWRCVQRLKWYYEQYEDGYFTIVDHDGGGRNYVGRFTTEVVPVETGNGMWDVQNVTFEEIPQSPMVQYPGDWEDDAIWHYPFNDFGDQKTAASGAWTAAYPLGTPPAGVRKSMSLSNPNTNDTDWAQHEYRGYGFQLWMLKGPAFGMVQVCLDTVLLETVDLYSAAALGPQSVYKLGEVPLDLHRVQVVMTGMQNEAASGSTAIWWGLQVMR